MNESNSPLVTIGIPTYNRANAYLRKAIERALGQTYQNIEVVVSDNCSTDHTEELVRSIKDPRLRYFRQKTNIGPNNNYNYCLDQARGSYFLLFHDDDMIDEDFIETCMSSLVPGQNVGAIFTGVRVIDQNDNVLEESRNITTATTPTEFIMGWYEGETALYLCNTVYNTERLKEVGGFGSKKDLFDDLVPTFTLVTKFGRADAVELKASFRRHTSNRGASVAIDDWVEDCLYLLDKICELIPEDCKSLRKVGNQFLARKMYRHAQREKSLFRRIIYYLRIYKSFGYSYSPLRFVYISKIRGRIRRLKRLFVTK